MANRNITTTEESSAQRMIDNVFGSKIWANDLKNTIPGNHNLYLSYTSMLKYVQMLQKQIQGLQENIRNIR